RRGRATQRWAAAAVHPRRCAGGPVRGHLSRCRLRGGRAGDLHALRTGAAAGRSAHARQGRKDAVAGVVAEPQVAATGLCGGGHPWRRAQPDVRGRVFDPEAGHPGTRRGREPPGGRAGGRPARARRRAGQRHNEIQAEDPMTDPDSPIVHRSGHVAIVGRPNVGKSTLLNRMVGQKLSITSDRPQTTRHRIAGIVTRPDAQLVFIDSPGYQTRSGGALNRVLNRTAVQVAEDADVVVLVCDARGWTPADERIAKLLPADRPVLLAINKVDAVPDKARLLELVKKATACREFDEVVPISARTGRQVSLLLDLCAARLPEGPALYDADLLTDRSERFLAAELIREKLFRQLGDELPYD